MFTMEEYMRLLLKTYDMAKARGEVDIPRLVAGSLATVHTLAQIEQGKTYTTDEDLVRFDMRNNYRAQGICLGCRAKKIATSRSRNYCEDCLDKVTAKRIARFSKRESMQQKNTF
jgi:hypothetical protein